MQITPPPDFVILQIFAHQNVQSKIFLIRYAREIMLKTNTVRIVWK